MSNKDYWQKTQINTCQNKEGLCLLIPWQSDFCSYTLSSFWFSLNDSLWDQRTFWSKGWQWHYSDVTHGCYTKYKDVRFNFTDICSLWFRHVAIINFTHQSLLVHLQRRKQFWDVQVFFFFTWIVNWKEAEDRVVSLKQTIWLIMITIFAE